MEAFDPFTEAPVQGVSWDFAPNFDEPLPTTDFQLPRMVRVSFGLRF